MAPPYYPTLPAYWADPLRHWPVLWEQGMLYATLESSQVMLCLIGHFLHCLHSGKSQRPTGLLRLVEHRCFDGFTQNLSGKNGTTSKHAISLEKYSSIVARWVWWMACLPNPWSVSRWPSVSLSSNLQVSEAGAIHPYPSGATRGVSATNTLFQSVLHSTLLAGTVHSTLLLWFLPRTAQGIWARGSCS